MRAVQFDRFGGPEVLELRELPIPVPRPDEALVRVHAAGLNPKDAAVRAGPQPPWARGGFPRGTGFDFAGIVAGVGAQVQDLEPGARVFGFLDGVRGGAAAEYLAVPRAWLARMPTSVDFVHAAALPLVASTALQALRDVAALKAGERVLIKGGSGGVGTAAIQLAKRFGAHVTATARGAGIEHCRAHGADVVIDYARDDPAAGDYRFDVFLDCVGASGPAYRRLLARGGRWITVAPVVPIFILTPITRLLAPLVGGRRLGFVMVRPVRADLETIARLVAAGELRMPVSETYTLEDIRTAHEAVAQRHGSGKRVLTITEAP